MFPAGTAIRPCPCRFPRVRGDVPPQPLPLPLWWQFSPRARGCSSRPVLSLCSAWVFPACAGMFLIQEHALPADLGFPRVRGDVPVRSKNTRQKAMFSPRARGCSLLAMKFTLRCKVFPACAGMFLYGVGHGLRTRSFPRVRGDVPTRVISRKTHRKFSPRARGCSGLALMLRFCQPVFPACAGMFPARARKTRTPKSFPRVRGDVPQPVQLDSSISAFSPRARGCSPPYQGSQRGQKVFPACAGMFRSSVANLPTM